MRFFKVRRDQVVLVALIFLSIAILTLHTREEKSGILHRVQNFSRELTHPLESAITRIATPFLHGWEYVVNIGRLQRDNQELRKELAQAKEKLVKLRVADEENKQLRKLLGLKEELPYETLTARVIGRIFSGGQAVIMIDKGVSHGVSEGMPVLIKEGLIGQVVYPSSNVSLVQLIIDPKSGVGVQILRTGESGVLQGQINGELEIQLISKEADVKKGDVVITSGLGGIYPKGIYVGEVSEVIKQSSGLFKKIKVKSKINFLRVELVLVITNPPKTEKFPFEGE